MNRTPMAERQSGGMKAGLYIAAVATVGAAVIGASAHHVLAAGLESRHLAWLGLAALTLLVGRLSLRLPLGCCKVSFSDALIFVSVWIFGSDLATLTAALDGCAASAHGRGTWYKRVFNTAAMAISVNLSSRLFWMTLPEAARSAAGSFDPAGLILPMLLLAAGQYLLNAMLVAVAIRLKEGVSLTAIWQGSLPWAGTGYLVGSAAAAVVFIAVRELGVGCLLAVLPLPPLFYLGFRARLGRLGLASSGSPSTTQNASA